VTGRVFDRQDQALAKAVMYLKNTKTLVVKTYITEAGSQCTSQRKSEPV
jgi:hypothetical protein